MITEQKNVELWKIAKRRSAFKYSLTSYLAINGFLIAVWLFSTGENSYFWPGWCLMGWGIGIAIQYIHAYHGSSMYSAEAEYEKLKDQHHQ
jgi:2TM domain